MGELPHPDSFVSWDDVLRGFKRQRGADPLFNIPDGWLSVAAWYAERGDECSSEMCLEAGLVREAYDRDTYQPPLELQRQYGPAPPFPAIR